MKLKLDRDDALALPSDASLIRSHFGRDFDPISTLATFRAELSRAFSIVKLFSVPIE